MIRIGVDTMGGDYAPQNVVIGAIEAQKHLPDDVRLYLIGDKIKIAEICRQQEADLGNFIVINCTQTIMMGEHPVSAYMKKRDSSIVVGYNMLAKGEIDAFASAGNTGAMLMGSTHTIKPINGILRPCISAEIPLLGGGKMLILDVGLNSDCKADFLLQFAQLGNIYAKTIFGIESPRIALLNIGGEEEKGNIVNQEAYKLLSFDSDLNFVGNMEANHLFRGDIADVLVTDGFVGNVCIKQAEAMYDLFTALGGRNEYMERFDYEIYGGTQILGIGMPVIIGHGASSPKAIANMIYKTEISARSNLIKNFLSIFAN